MIAGDADNDLIYGGYQSARSKAVQALTGSAAI